MTPTIIHRPPETHTIKEIKLLQLGSVQINHLTLIQTRRHPKPRYEIHFDLHIQKQCIRSTLITTRNQPYQLANLDRGITFLQTVFLGVDVIEVKL